MAQLKITGNPNPVVGKEEFYSVSQLLPSALPFQNLGNTAVNPFEETVTWSVHLLEHGRWRKTKGNDKTGNKVHFTFLQQSLNRNGLRIIAKKGEHEARLDIKPHKAESPKIHSIDFLDKNGQQPTQPFAYGQTLKARVHCLHMEHRTIYATLWEDDAAGAGHNKANEKNKMKTLPGTVKDGIADIDFVLEPDFAKIANALKAKGDTDEGKTHEYYVTAEIFHKKTASVNTNVANPDYKVSTATPAAAKKQTPAQKKGPSKKHQKENYFGDDIIDWWEGLINVKPIVAPNPKPPTGNNLLKVGEPDKNPKEDKKQKNTVCACKDDDLIWGNKIGCKERKKVIEVAANLGVKPNWLMAVMALETAKTFSPSIDNGIGYVGLIQFGKDAAETAKTTQQKLVKMTFIEQMDYVQKFLIDKKDKYKTLVDLYLAVLYPNACGYGGEKNYIVLNNKAYRNNPLFFQEEDEITRSNKGKIISRHPKVNGHTFVWEVDLAIRAVFSQGLSNKTKSFTCELNTVTKTPANCKCTKTHIDLRPTVKWHSQFDSQWGDKKAQNVACWKASQQILTNSGLGTTSGYPAGAIQMAKEVDKHTKMEYLPDGLKAGIKYIDEQLEKNNPILVGVNHDLNYHGEKNNDHTTDHFVVIIGRDCDDNGAFYIFYEVGTQYKKSGASDDNKLYILSNRIEGKTAYSSPKLYQVTQVRKNN